MTRLVLIIFILISQQAVGAKNFFAEMRANIKRALTPSEFICDRYERQEYEVKVLRPNFKLPFTEVKPKQRHCVKWEEAGKGATGKKCVEYEYLNTSDLEQKSMYRVEKRYRTVCVEGHNSREGR